MSGLSIKLRVCVPATVVFMAALGGCLQEPEPDYTVRPDASADAATPPASERDAGVDATATRPGR